MSQPLGRPSSYTPEVAAKICEGLREGKSLITLCSEEGMPARGTVHRWLDEHADFQAAYTRARTKGLEALADDLIHIANTPMEGISTETTLAERKIIKRDMIEHRKLQIDTRKWYLSKLAPKIYGDKSTVDVNVNDKTVARLAAGRKRAGR